jgi:subtilisin family serine protease
VIVVPAGNHDDLKPRYPAGLHGSHENVIAVGSVQRDTHKRSQFSNHGDWVTCYAIGEPVESTFLWVDMKLEDDKVDQKWNFKTNAWARWNGTSFATPKVAARIASKLSEDPTLTPLEAWYAVRDAAPILTGLGPFIADTEP